ncbi:MAG: hypothetical protein WCH42_03515 [Actinomycetes bacterium]
MKIAKHPARLLAGILAALLVTGCGIPSQKYAADKKHGVYFTVPYKWHEISGASIGKRELLSTTTGAAERAASVLWQEAFSPNSHYGPTDVLNLKAPSSPLVYVRVRTLLPDEVGVVSYNSLRNIIVPLTTWASGADSTAPLLDVLDDREIIQKIARGVRTIYSFTEAGKSPQTINQTALVSDDRSTIYVLIVRCTTVCYNKNEKLLNKISDSFTVRGTR